MSKDITEEILLKAGLNEIGRENNAYISDDLRIEAEASFKKYCNNPLFRDIYIRAYIRGANWAKTNKY